MANILEENTNGDFSCFNQLLPLVYHGEKLIPDVYLCRCSNRPSAPCRLEAPPEKEAATRILAESRTLVPPILSPGCIAIPFDCSSALSDPNELRPYPTRTGNQCETAWRNSIIEETRQRRDNTRSAIIFTCLDARLERRVTSPSFAALIGVKCKDLISPPDVTHESIRPLFECSGFLGGGQRVKKNPVFLSSARIQGTKRNRPLASSQRNYSEVRRESSKCSQSLS